MMGGVNSKLVTAGGKVSSVDGLVNALCSVLLTAGSDAATAVIYDGTSASGTKLATLKATADSSASWEPGCLAINKGNIYVDISGTGPECVVSWK